jgi:hypothetical protein
VSVQPGIPATHEGVARSHLVAWAEALLGSRRALLIDGRIDAAALRSSLEAERWDAVRWLDAAADDLPVDALRSAGEAGLRVLLAVRGLDRRQGAGVAERLRGIVAGSQVLVQGSMIASIGGEPPAAVELDTGSVHDGAVHRLLLAVNVDEEEASRAAGAVAQLVVDTTFVTQLGRLEAAYWELRRANARLTRKNLGRHDAAAASVVGRLTTELRETSRQLEIEIEVARRNDEYFQGARAKLDEPHHRAAERLYQMLGALPGGRALTRRALSRGR